MYGAGLNAMSTLLRFLSTFARVVALAMALVSAVIALAAQAGRVSDRLDVLTHLTPFWLVAALVALAIWLVAGRVGRLTPALAGLGVVASLLLMGPELLAASGGRTAQAAEGETLKIVQFNLWGRNRDPEATVAWILAQNPDVVVLEEAFARSGGAARALHERLPYQVSCAYPQPCSTIMLSRLKPLRAGGLSAAVSDANLAGSWATLPSRQGPFTVVGVHYTWPVPAGPQQQMTLRLARTLERFPKDRLIVAGDFNSTPWSFSMRRQDALFGLERRTRALPSWPAADTSRHGLPTPFPLLPIDHVYAGDGWRTVSVKRGPRLGSDHYPVVVTLAPAVPSGRADAMAPR